MRDEGWGLGVGGWGIWGVGGWGIWNEGKVIIRRHEKKKDNQKEGDVCPAKWFVFAGTLRRLVLTGSGRDGLVWDQARVSLRSKQPLTGACGVCHHRAGRKIGGFT